MGMADFHLEFPSSHDEHSCYALLSRVENIQNGLSFGEASVDPETGKVRLSADKLMGWVKMATSEFIRHARNPERIAKIGGTYIQFSPVSGPPITSDFGGGASVVARKVRMVLGLTQITSSNTI